MKQFAVALMGSAVMAMGLAENEGWEPEPLDHYHYKQVPKYETIPAGTVVGHKYELVFEDQEQDVKVCKSKMVQRTKQVQKIVDYEEKDVVVG